MDIGVAVLADANRGGGGGGDVGGLVDAVSLVR